MIKQLLFSVSLMTAGMIIAAPLTPEEALGRVDRADILGVGTRGFTAQPVMVLNTQIEEPALYVFQGADSRGYLVVSADDAMVPVLGYSDSDNFNSEDMPPAMRYWLEQYAEQIEYAREQGLTTSASTRSIALPSNWTKISPLVKTQWNQSTPYNNKCPMQGNVHCYTGCVATSMAQILKYFNYPAKPEGEINYLAQSLNQRIKFDLSELTFDWSNMLNKYTQGSYNTTQADAVATLMMATGYSVEMNYTSSVSGAQSGKIAGAFVRNFKYDKSIRYISRDPYSYTEWATKVYENLKNVGPIIYNGVTQSTGGHSFVCDGYDGNGYFHFNWGWSGSGDGYYMLDALNPTNLGIGAGGGGYNFSQDGIFNITPDKGSGDEVGQNQIAIYGSVVGELTSANNLRLDLDGGSMSSKGIEILGWAYQGIENSYTLDLGIKIAPLNNPDDAVYLVSSNVNYNVNQELVPGQYLPTKNYYSGKEYDFCPYFPLSSLNLQQGVQYKVTNVYRATGQDTWYDVIYPHGNFNYFYITKTGNGSTSQDFSIQNFLPLQFSCQSLTLDSDLYNGIAAIFTTTISNGNNEDLTRGLAVALLDDKGNLSFTGSTQVISLAPGQSETKQVTTIFTPVNSSVVVSRPTTFYLALYDYDTDNIYYKSSDAVIMKPYPGKPYYSTNVTIDNAKWAANRYTVEDASNMVISTTISVTRNIFSYPVVLNILQQGSSNSYGETTYTPVLTVPYETVILNSGQSHTYTTTVNFTDADVKATYYLGLIVNNDNTLVGDIIPFYVEGNSGVDELVAEGAEVELFYDRRAGKVIAFGNVANIEAYSLAGVKLAGITPYGEEASIDVSTLGKGIVLVTATDTQGQKKTIKIAL